MKKTGLAFLIVVILAFTVINALGESSDPFTAGISLFNKAEYKGAAEELAKAVQEKPKNAARRVTYGVALANIKKHDEAITQFKAAAEIDPKDPIPHFLLEAAYASKGLTTDAANENRLGKEMLRSIAGDGTIVVAGPRHADNKRKWTPPPPPLRPKPLNSANDVDGLPDASNKLAIEQDLAEHPDNAIAHTLLGDTYQLVDRYDEAVAHYKTAADLAPTWTKPWYNMGMATRTVNPSQAVMCFRKVIELDPSNQEAQLRLGDALSREKNYPQALEVYQKVAKNDAQLNGELNAKARVGMGNVYMQQQNLEAAQQQFDTAAQIAPNNPGPYVGRAEVYSRKQMPDKSAREYQFAMANASPMQQAAVSNRVASAFVQNGDYNGAIRELKKTIAQTSPLLAPVETLVSTYQRAQMIDQGICEYEANLQKKPGDIVSMRFLLEAYGATGQTTKQAVMAKKLLKYAPTESPMWNGQLGSALAASGDSAGAIAAWKAGLAAEPGVDRAGIIPAAEAYKLLDSIIDSYKPETAGKRLEAPYLILSSIYEYKRDYRQAAEVVRKLVAMYPNKQELWIYLGDDLSRCGDTAGATNAYKKASAMNDNPTLRAVAIQRLKDTK